MSRPDQLSAAELLELGHATSEDLGADVLTALVDGHMPAEVVALSSIELRGLAAWLRAELEPVALEDATAARVADAATALDFVARLRRDGGGL